MFAFSMRHSRHIYLTSETSLCLVTAYFCSRIKKNFDDFPFYHFKTEQSINVIPSSKHALLGPQPASWTEKCIVICYWDHSLPLGQRNVSSCAIRTTACLLDREMYRHALFGPQPASWIEKCIVICYWDHSLPLGQRNVWSSH